MSNLHTIHCALNPNHDLLIHFNDKSEDIMSEIMEEANKVNNRNMKIRSVLDALIEVLEVVDVVVLFMSLIGILFAELNHEHGGSIGYVIFFRILLAISSIGFLSILFDWDVKIYKRLKRKLCGSDYSVNNYINMKRVIEICSEKRDNLLDIVNNIFDPVVRYEYAVHKDRVIINLCCGVTINNDLKNDVILINGHMDLGDKCYKANIQMNEDTMYCLNLIKKK